MKSVIAAVLAALVMASLAGAAGADDGLGMSPTASTLTLSELELEGGLGTPMRCDVTMDAAFHERVTKVSGALMGQADVALSTGGCTDGDIGLLVGGRRVTGAQGPYHLTYDSFTGELPSIESVTLTVNDVSFWISISGIDCLTDGPVDISFTTLGGNPARGMAINSQSVPLTGDFLCIFTSIELNGAGSLSRSIGMTLTDSAELTPSPSRVVIEPLEASDRFTITNTGAGTATATIDSVSLTGVDTEGPELEVSSPGCGSTIADGASCVYTIAVNERPLREAAVRIEYDDGLGRSRTASIPVEVQGVDPEAELRGEPVAVTIDALEQSGALEIRNTGGGATATIDRVTATTSDAERPEFTVTSGCRARLADDEACHYLITVNSRPEASGRIAVEYDDGEGNDRSVSIDVDVVGPRPAELEADPTSVVIGRLESNDSFVIRNIGAEATTAVITRIEIISSDEARPDFTVTGPGCTLIMLDETSCTYIVSVNARPESAGRAVFHYEDGIGNARTTTVEVDIAT